MTGTFDGGKFLIFFLIDGTLLLYEITAIIQDLATVENNTIL